MAEESSRKVPLVLANEADDCGNQRLCSTAMRVIQSANKIGKALAPRILPLASRKQNMLPEMRWGDPRPVAVRHVA
jgi:hypothetical protein